ncbi:uncharacterized protein EDB93DRAFT_1176074 [Suillus bovinus]|uniref:uncharacterized protein n=1 Tax=Suillus bovinus TaxID=48563 RepID=UPI001B86EE0C|nr:uncharacterized protein EDB93DRAFT_1176074 [Suillus bovinus]KAG2132711.1 hypothetical protein EDB93DRAFT_1176074 [Suillus bovinus]
MLMHQVCSVSFAEFFLLSRYFLFPIFSFPDIFFPRSFLSPISPFPDFFFLPLLSVISLLRFPSFASCCRVCILINRPSLWLAVVLVPVASFGCGAFPRGS